MIRNGQVADMAGVVLATALEAEGDDVEREVPVGASCLFVHVNAVDLWSVRGTSKYEKEL